MSTAGGPSRVQRVFYWAALVLLGGMMLMPLVFMVNTSFKSTGEVYADPPTFWPTEPQWDNFTSAFTQFPFLRYLGNTLLLTVLRVLGTLITCTLVAWGFARYRSRWTKPLFVLCLATMMLPPQVTSIPVFTMYVKLGLYNTYVPLILGSWLAQSAFFIFLLRQFFAGIPEDLKDITRFRLEEKGLKA